MPDGFSRAPAEFSQQPLQSILEHIRTLCRRFQIISLDRQIDTCETLLQQNQPIDIAILGQFKAGKSTFLNSLIGKEILPVGAIPVTTVITRLQFGEKELEILDFRGNPTLRID